MFVPKWYEYTWSIGHIWEHHESHLPPFIYFWQLNDPHGSGCGTVGRAELSSRGMLGAVEQAEPGVYC